MKSNNKKSTKKEKNIGKKDRMEILLEDMRDDIKLVAEGHSVLVRKIDVLDSKVDGLTVRMDKVESRMDGMESRMDGMESGIDGMEKKMEEGFKLILDHLDRLDRELMELKNDLKNNYERKGHDAVWKKAIEQRLEKLEKLLVVKKMAKN